MGSRNTYGRNGHSKPQPPGRENQTKRLRVLVSAEELEYYTYIKCRNVKVFPKKDRAALPTRMMNEASDIVDYLEEANDLDHRDPIESDLRIAAQRKALRKCRALTRHIRLVKRLNLINADVFDYWAKLANNVRHQAAAWHKSDKDRIASLRAR